MKRYEVHLPVYHVHIYQVYANSKRDAVERARAMLDDGEACDIVAGRRLVVTEVPDGYRCPICGTPGAPGDCLKCGPGIDD